jgi:NAD(P)-dependent dehydrogenase (short-subunit alcohol dehydrogenase family)
MEFSNKPIVITVGSKGIGAARAQLFHGAGPMLLYWI